MVSKSIIKRLGRNFFAVANRSTTSLITMFFTVFMLGLGADTALAQDADLHITKFVDDTSPDEGQTIIYTVNVQNQGPSTATGVLIEDILPAGVTFDSSTLIEPAGATYDPVTGLWDVGATSLPKDQEFDLEIVASVDTGTNGQTITNTASVFQPRPDRPECRQRHRLGGCVLVLTKQIRGT